MHNIDRSATIILGLSWVYFVTRAFLRGQVQHVSFKQRHSAILEFHLEEVSNERWIVDSKGGIVWFKPMSFCSLHSTQRFLNVSRPGCWCVFYRFCGPTFYRFLTDFRRYHFGLFGSIWVYLGLFWYRAYPDMLQVGNLKGPLAAVESRTHFGVHYVL